MAIYYFHVGFISRSTGRSAVQSAAYITGNQLEETRRNITADYRNRSSDIIFSTTLAPDHAPAYMKNLGVWNALETHEDQYASLRYRTEINQEKYKSCAQTAQTIVVALPKELTPGVWKELVTDFVRERFVSRGLVVSLAIHNDEGNPHAHFQISRRAVTDKGEWSWAKDRDIATKASLIESRRLWAEKTNFYLTREGLETRIDHRSYADLGIPFEPTKHENWYAHNLEKSGRNSRVIEENKEIKNRNKEYLGLNPDAILKELTTKQATFSTINLSRIIQSRLGDDPVLASYVYESSLSQAVAVGMSLDGQIRYTSQEYIQLENQVLQNSDSLMKSKSSISISKSLLDKAISSEYDYLSDEQKQAVTALCDSHNLNVLIGKAGTGKTTTLKSVVDLHQQSGYKICGLSLSATAAENLALETNCNAETVAFYIDKWGRREEAYQKFWSIHTSKEHPSLERNLHDLDQYSLTDKHLVIVDEAGMIGTNQWASILTNVEKSKAKLIVVGDDHQFKAIEAGDFFRKLKDKAQESDRLLNLNTIVRQKEDWMKKASQDLSEYKTYQALSTYEQQGHIKQFEKAELKTIAEAYIEKLKAKPEQTGLLLASTRSQCQTLNDETRQLLKDNKLISENDINVNGRSFAIGDEIIFLKNDRDQSITCFDTSTNLSKNFLVKNGSRGKILNFTRNNDEQSNIGTTTKQPNDSYQFTIEIDKHTIARFNTNKYHHFDHSYAITLHKAQGQTVDWSIIVASKNMDAQATYVALTRHRKDTVLYYDSESFKGFKDLQQSLSRVSNKDLVIDYTIKPEHHGAWENIQEYRLLGQDLISMARENDWVSYQNIKNERIALGHTILSDWKDHASYAQQAGFSQESIKIACGLKMRPLSLVEEQAKTKVQEYYRKSLEARLLWREIRKTHPGKHCYEHSKYSEFDNLRKERNIIAKDIIENRPLYKEFVSKLSHELGIGWKTIQNQSKQINVDFKDFHYKTEKTFIAETLKKYQLEKPVYISDADFNKNIQKLNERIQLWDNLLRTPPHRGKEHDLLEKAVIAEVIKHEAKKEYCFLSSPSEAAIRSEGIAVATATIIQEAGNTKNLTKSLEKGAQIHDECFNTKSKLSIDDNRNRTFRTQIDKLNDLIAQQQNKETSVHITPSKSKDINLEL